MPLLNVGCGGDDDTPQPTDNVLNKELILDKTWVNESRTVAHIFNSDGSYGIIGTWEWVNNSDTIHIQETSSKLEYFWVVNKGNTENKMEMRLSGDTGWAEYRVTW